MSASAPPTAAAGRSRVNTRGLRIGFLGPSAWLDIGCPPELTAGHSSCRLPVVGGCDIERIEQELTRFRPHVSIIFDPYCLPVEWLRRLPGRTLGVLVGPEEEAQDSADRSLTFAALDRTLSFRPELTGTEIGSARLWRAVPPPISDALFGEVRRVHGLPRSMSLGRSTEYREQMLMPAKHHHDLLQVIHGVHGETLAKMLREYDVGVYVPRGFGGGFGAQIGMHLAAGQLLLATGLAPAHGLERDIDYVHFDSAAELVWALDRLGRFPEMYERVRIRGRLKAESYRASTMFARIVHDLLADLSAFGSTRTQS